MKTLKLACLFLLALTAAGCGKKILIPEKTVVAAYIDLEKAYVNGKSCAKTIIDALPSDESKAARKEYEEALKKIDKIVDNLNAEWAVVTFGGNLKNLAHSSDLEAANNLAVAVKVDADKAAVKRVLEDVFEMKDVDVDKKNGQVVFDFPRNKGLHVGLIDDQYLIFSSGKDAFDDMFDLYAGNGRDSDEFDDLARISGDTVCRIQTASVASLLKRFELEKYVEKFGEASEDEELANMILNMGSISLDVTVGDEVGLALHVACDSSSDAKIIEGLMRSIAIYARVGCDFAAYFAENPEQIPGYPSRKDKKALAESKDLFINLAKNIEADRSWGVATLSFTLETDKIADCIRKVTSDDEKRSTRDDDDDEDNAKWALPVRKPSYNGKASPTYNGKALQ